MGISMDASSFSTEFKIAFTSKPSIRGYVVTFGEVTNTGMITASRHPAISSNMDPAQIVHSLRAELLFIRSGSDTPWLASAFGWVLRIWVSGKVMMSYGSST